MPRKRRDVIDASEYRQFQTEAELQRSIENQAIQLGYLVQHDELARGKYKGYPDLTICGHGVVFWVECKGPKGSTTVHQDRWIEQLKKAGRFVIVASTEDDSYDRVVTLLQDYYQRDMRPSGRG